MRRRDVLCFLSAAGAWPFAAQAQQGKRALRVAWVGYLPRTSPMIAVIPRRLAEFGYKEGDNLIIDYVQVAGTPESIYAGYRELATRMPDILVSIGSEAALKAALATSVSTPIVALASEFDPVAAGYASSLAKPGGRVTGVYFQRAELVAKRLQFFKEAIPDLGSAVVFFDKATLGQWDAAVAASNKLGVQLFGVELRDFPYEYDDAFAKVPLDLRKNLLVLGSPVFFADRERMAKFGLSHRLASMFDARQYVEAGGLMSYGASYDTLSERVADKVGQIAQGARPGDLPIEQPNHFEFVVNLSTARALEIELSPTLLAAADAVIE